MGGGGFSGLFLRAAGQVRRLARRGVPPSLIGIVIVGIGTIAIDRSISDHQLNR
jgi:hypothetical protein